MKVYIGLTLVQIGWVVLKLLDVGYIGEAPWWFTFLPFLSFFGVSILCLLFLYVVHKLDN